MEQIEFYIETVARLVDWIAIAILLYGAFFAIGRFVILELQRLGRTQRLDKESYVRFLDINVRRSLAAYLLLGLEIMIVSDIIHTAISRTLNDLLLLGGVVLIRTVVSYFLGKEILHLDKNQ